MFPGKLQEVLVETFVSCHILHNYSRKWHKARIYIPLPAGYLTELTPNPNINYQLKI